MSLENNKAVVRSFFERAINQGDLNWLEQIIAPGFGAGEARTLGVYPTGPMHARAMVENYRRAFPDIQFAVEDLLAEGDRVVVRVTFCGTHRGEFMGVPASGRQVSSSGVELAILANGQIVAAGWQYHDELGLLRQLGALCPRAATHVEAWTEVDAQRPCKAPSPSSACHVAWIIRRS